VVFLPALLAFALQPASIVPKPRVARLSGDTVPISYDLHVEPVFDPTKWRTSMLIDGSETIRVTTTRDLDDIVLNASHTSIHEATIDGQAAVATLDETRQQLTLHAAHRLSHGEHTILLAFKSEKPGDGFRQYGLNPPALATMFEPSMARGVFPCFDEPQFKAAFTVHVRAPSTWDVVSNMPQASRTPQGDGTDSFDFQPTPPMPVYLLTFDMGVFAHADGRAGATPIRVYVSPGKEAQAAVILADAQRLLPFYEGFFATRYPLPKLDIVVVNNGYETALEGWGAITVYAQDEAFGEQMGGGTAGRLYAIQVVAHEMAHQWVGDLVTMRWWRDTFVAEGLAEFSQQRAVSELFPEMRSWADDDRDVEYILARGTTAGRKAVVSDVPTDLNDDDDRMFDGAVYDKGAAVVRQWQSIVGEDAFQSGIAGYLKTHAYGSATFEEFWTAFPDARSLSYAQAWLTRPGFPLVDLDALCSGGRTTVTLEQRAYVTDWHSGASYRSQVWPLLLQMNVAGVEYTRFAPARHRSVYTLPGCGIVSIDAAFRPYARIRYERDAAVALGVRPERERTRTFYDDAAMHRDGYLNTRDYLAAVASPQAFSGLDFAVTGATATELDGIREALTGSPLQQRVVTVEQSILVPALGAHPLDEPGSSLEEQGALRALFTLAAAGDPTFSSAGRALFFKYASGWTNRLYDVQWGSAAVAGITATQSDVDRVEALLRTGQVRQTGQLFLENVRDEKLLPGILADARSDPRISGGSFTYFLFAVGSHSPRFVFAYLRTHLHEVRASVPPTQQAYAICGGIAATLWSAASPAEAARFMHAAFPADDAIARNALARIHASWTRRSALEDELSY
jgi:Peptidase family M1 domain/Peptidase M1 N-terminal domain